jgi:WD40 repeat protein
MTSSTPLRDSAFISYSHKDRALLEQFQAHLKPLIRDHNLRVWDDTNIKPGDTWKAEIERALASARVAVLLISHNFLASDFIHGEELPRLLKAAKNEGARILPVILSPSVFSLTPLSQFQTVNDPARPLIAMKNYEQEEVWASLAIEVYQALTAPYPIGTCLLTYTGHNDPVNTVAWAPEGKHIASGSGMYDSDTEDYTVQIWEVATGRRIVTYQGHAYWVNAVAWAPDGKLIASASEDRTVQIWETMTGHRIFTYAGHSDSVEAVAWAPEGKIIASASEDKTVQVWDVTTGRHIYTYAGHTSAVNAIAWAPDSKYIASGGGNWQAPYGGGERKGQANEIHIWAPFTGLHLYTYNDHWSQVKTIAWAPVGKRIASGGGNWQAKTPDNRIHVWDATTSRRLFKYTGHTSVVSSIAWSPDSKHIASADWDGTIQIWDAETAQHLYTYTGHSDVVTSVAWSPDGKRIASASYDKTVQVWSAG